MIMALHRPYIRQEIRDEVERRAEKNEDGLFLDANTHEPIDGQYDLGHIAGHEHWREVERAEEEGLTQEEFNDRMNNPDYYQIEDPHNNRSHIYEKPADDDLLESTEEDVNEIVYEPVDEAPDDFIDVYSDQEETEGNFSENDNFIDLSDENTELSGDSEELSVDLSDETDDAETDGVTYSELSDALLDISSIDADSLDYSDTIEMDTTDASFNDGDTGTYDDSNSLV